MHNRNHSLSKIAFELCIAVDKQLTHFGFAPLNDHPSHLRTRRAKKGYFAAEETALRAAISFASWTNKFYMTCLPHISHGQYRYLERIEPHKIQAHRRILP